MSYSIALNFEDGVTRIIECRENEKVLDAAYRQRINLPMDCSDGVCGTCKCHCESGSYDLGEDYLEDALSDEEASNHMVLTCQMVPESDCIIEVPSSSAVCKTTIETIETDVAEIEVLSEDCFELVLNLQGNNISYLPGQYANILVPGSDQWRSYSFSCKSGGDKISFLLRNVPNGLMSGYLKNNASQGETLSLRGPQGSFYLRPAERPIIMLAGGTGLAPMLAMLEQLEETGCQVPIRLFYGVNIDDHLVKTDALDRLTDALEDFDWMPVVVDKESIHERKGFVTDHLPATLFNEGDADVYLCGPPPMVDAIIRYLDSNGIEPHGFYYEKFVPKAHEAAA